MDRLINFVDLVPTLLSIVGIPVPEYMQGKAFLGNQKTKDPEYTYMSRLRMDERYDNVRAIRDKRYRYIRNYMPFRITMQHVDYMFLAPSAQSWEDAFRAGKTNEVQSRDFLPKPVEELYDSENDPWEVNNLADDPEYADVKQRLSKALDDWRTDTRDVGVIPETEYGVLAGDTPMYDYVRSPECQFNKMIEASDAAVLGGPADLSKFVDYLKSENSAIRYWGATGLLILKENARPAIPSLLEAAGDKSASVATLAAEALYGLGEKESAVKAYIRILNDTVTFNMTDRNFVLNSIDAINYQNPDLTAAVQKLYSDRSVGFTGSTRYNLYDVLMSEYLLKKYKEK